jgi:choline dehydrogenase-like flavoprotein
MGDLLRLSNIQLDLIFNHNISIYEIQAIPEGAADTVWYKWLEQTCTLPSRSPFTSRTMALHDIPPDHSNFRPVGTAAMIPEYNGGGVVNERLGVYGTLNARVVDTSMFPFQLCGHLASTVYVVVEGAADLVKQDGACSDESELEHVDVAKEEHCCEICHK